MIVFDTETTGLLRPNLCELHLQPSITEIYLCKMDLKGKITGEFKTFIKPLLPIPEEITKITGITNEMVADAPRFIEIYDDLCNFFLGERTIVAHNCSFDMGMLSVELQRHDLEMRFPWCPNQICTVEVSYCIKNKRMALDELYKMATGKEIQSHHRAESDTRNLVKIVAWLIKEGFINEANC